MKYKTKIIFNRSMIILLSTLAATQAAGSILIIKGSIVTPFEKTKITEYEII